MDSVERGTQAHTDLGKLKRKFFWNLIDFFNSDTQHGGKYIIFKKKSAELTQTIDGDACQEWGSNSTHYEGDLLKFWKTPVSIHKDGLEFGSMTTELKEAAKDGLMTYEGDKFKRHNKCRNPNNAEGAPWCYTKNPKVRWQYCALPDDSTKHRNYVMIAVFFMLILLAVFLVKLIFRNEWFSKLVAALTGGNLMSKAVFSANQVAGNITANAGGPGQTTAGPPTAQR